MKLKTKIRVIYFLTAVFLTASAFGVVYYYTSFNLHVEVFTRLDAIAKAKELHIQTFLDQTKGRMVDFGSDGKIKECLYVANGGAGDLCSIDEFNEHLKINKLPAIDSLIEVTALNTKGVVVSSTLMESIGQDVSTKALFFEGKVAPYIEDIGYSETFAQNLYYVSAPVYRNDDFVGVIIGGFKTESLFTVLQGQQGLGTSGDIFIVNMNGYLVSPTKYDEDVLLTQRVNTENRIKCVDDYRLYKGTDQVENHQEEILVYENHRGQSAIGSHAYVEEMNWCVIAEMDEDEALSSVSKSLSFLGGTAIAILLIVFFIAGGVGNILSRPIVKLKEGLEIIEEGHLDHSIATDEKNEFGELSRSIERILNTLRHMRDESGDTTKNKKDE